MKVIKSKEASCFSFFFLTTQFHIEFGGFLQYVTKYAKDFNLKQHLNKFGYSVLF